MQELLIVAGAHLLAVASPGPDLALVLKNSLGNGKKIGIYTALGVALGILVHVLYSVVGLALIISQSIVLFNVIKLLGAGYLLWIGIKALKTKKTEIRSEDDVIEDHLRSVAAVRQGFLTNVLNPKATLFFLSLFTQVISVDTSLVLKTLYGLEMTVVTFVWFTLIALFMTRKPVRALYMRMKHYIDRTFGIALIALSLKIATSSNN